MKIGNCSICGKPIGIAFISGKEGDKTLYCLKDAPNSAKRIPGQKWKKPYGAKLKNNSTFKVFD